MQPDAKTSPKGFKKRSNEPDGTAGLKTILDHKNRILRVLNYIENNLSSLLQTGEIAQVACLSRYHFHRKFLDYTGSTVATYIRNRRLTKAAHILLASKGNVTDIAFSMGYGASEAFTKAFKRRYGFPPSALISRKTTSVSAQIAGRPNLIVLKPLMEIRDDKSRGIDAFWELQKILAEVQPDSLDSTWVSVFPDAGTNLTSDLRIPSCFLLYTTPSCFRTHRPRLKKVGPAATPCFIWTSM